MKAKSIRSEQAQLLTHDVVSVGRLAKSLPDLVAEQLMLAIRSGKISQGERLKEEMLADSFEVSRSTIREAIALLERKGVVERVPRQGARVITVDAEEIEEIFLIRAQLLGLAARLFAESAPSKLLIEFENQIKQIGRLADKSTVTPIDYANASIAAQRTLISFGNRNRLRTIYEDLSDAALWRAVIRERAISFSTAARRKESAQDWQRVALAISTREGSAAEEHAKTLLLHSYHAVKQGLAQERNNNHQTVSSNNPPLPAST